MPVTDPRNIVTTQEDYDEKSLKKHGMETMDNDNPFWRDFDDPNSDSFRFNLMWEYIECLDFGSIQNRAHILVFRFFLMSLFFCFWRY